jgi:hypothetical protein
VRPTPVDVWVVRPGEAAWRVARLKVARDVVQASVESWSPSGTGILVKLSDYAGECRYQEHLRDTVYLVPAGGHRRPARPLVVTSGEIGHADWSPNGRLIAITSGSGDACQLDVYKTNGRFLRTVARFEYVPGGCFSDGLASAWVPTTEQLVFSNGATVFAGHARSGPAREIYRARPGLRACGSETVDCPNLWIRDVAITGHLLVSVQASANAAARSVRVVAPDGKPHRFAEHATETAIRFASRR